MLLALYNDPWWHCAFAVLAIVHCSSRSMLRNRRPGIILTALRRRHNNDPTPYNTHLRYKNDCARLAHRQRWHHLLRENTFRALYPKAGLLACLLRFLTQRRMYVLGPRLPSRKVALQFRCETGDPATRLTANWPRQRLCEHVFTLCDLDSKDRILRVLDDPLASRDLVEQLRLLQRLAVHSGLVAQSSEVLMHVYFEITTTI